MRRPLLQTCIVKVICMPTLLLTLLLTLAGCSFPVRQPGIHDFAEDKVTVRVKSNAGDYAPRAVQSNPEE